ncbi:MAG: hypothetical protein ACLPWS_22405 [Rhodomicrobium sp.]
MRALFAVACAVLMAALSVPASAHHCATGRCALAHGYGPRLPGHAVLGKCCCRAPSGWGHYLRQKLRDDCAAPLVIVDELGGVTLTRGRR